MNILKALLDLFYPPHCPFCDSLLGSYHRKSGDSSLFESSFKELEAILCLDCLTALPWLENCCNRCAHPRLEKSDACPFCSGFSFAFNSCCTVGRYKGVMRNILHRFKYRGQKSLAEPLGKLMAAKLKNMPWCSLLEMIAPVPLSPEKLSLRGYNQAALLAEVVSKELKLPMQDLLKRTRNTESQTGLNRQQRRNNMKGSFICRDTSKAGTIGTILLIDDVFTSGSTAHEASFVLKKAGYRQVYVAVLAR